MSRYSFTLSALVSELLGKDVIVDESNLDENAGVIRHIWDIRSKEIQVNLPGNTSSQPIFLSFFRI
jgi:hypothetical protein